MVNIKALDKLRAAGRNMAKGRNLENREECNLLLVIADEIEAEISEKFVELPVDVEGVPIHLGDMVEGELLFDNATVRGTVTTYHIHGDDEPGTVYIKVKPTEDTWTIKELRFTRCRHVKPRTIEDVLGDAIGEYERAPMDDYDAVQRIAAKYADEIRELTSAKDVYTSF